MNLTLKQLSPGLHRRLKQQAERHGRSLNMEAMKILEEGIRPDLSEIFASMDRTNQRQKRPISGEEICAMIREDRDRR
jgi:plasmid stability protein